MIDPVSSVVFVLIICVLIVFIGTLIERKKFAEQKSEVFKEELILAKNFNANLESMLERSELNSFHKTVEISKLKKELKLEQEAFKGLTNQFAELHKTYSNTKGALKHLTDRSIIQEFDRGNISKHYAQNSDSILTELKKRNALLNNKFLKLLNTTRE